MQIMIPHFQVRDTISIIDHIKWERKGLTNLLSSFTGLYPKPAETKGKFRGLIWDS